MVTNFPPNKFFYYYTILIATFNLNENNGKFPLNEIKVFCIEQSVYLIKLQLPGRVLHNLSAYRTMLSWRNLK